MDSITNEKRLEIESLWGAGIGGVGMSRGGGWAVA